MKAARRPISRPAASGKNTVAKGASVKTATKPKPGEIRRRWIYWAGFGVALITAFQIYSPALRGPFVFDDLYLPFSQPEFSDQLKPWIAGVRPVLYFSYWLNQRWSGSDPGTYHLLNIFIHAAAATLSFFIFRKLLDLAGTDRPARDLMAFFAAAVFLIHPVQAEAVAYVAGRSDALSVLFLFAAFAIFLYRRRSAITWTTALAVLLLFGLAMGSKEHSVTFPALLLLTDYYFNPGYSFRGIARNWKLYGTATGTGLLVLYYFRNLFMGGSAGFGVKEFTWYQYFFTECRALLVYPRLLLLPIGQTVDWDFPISRTVLDHGAIAGLIALVALSVLAFIYRKRYPLASYGYFAYLILMAPTSSFVPIKDPIAERRVYLSMFALLLVGLEFLRRVHVGRKKLGWALSGVLLVLCVAAYGRAEVWSDTIRFWQDAVEKSPRKARPRFQLAYAFFSENRCDLAISNYEAASHLQPANYELLVDWALAYDCNNQRDLALAKLRQAAGIEATAHVYSTIGMIYAKDSKWAEALEALRTAERIDPNYPMVWAYRGGIYAATNDLTRAAEAYRKALSLDPKNVMAQQGLAAIAARQRPVR